MSQPDIPRALEFHAKATKFLKWCDTAFGEMEAFGQTNNVGDYERVFVAIVGYTSVIHESLASCAKKVCDLHWRADLNKLRDTDPLLFYLWKARNSETHDALVKWLPSMERYEFRWVDQARARQFVGSFALKPEAVIARAVPFIFGVSTMDEVIARRKSGAKPDAGRMAETGVEILPVGGSFGLNAFEIKHEGKVTKVAAPLSHLGQLIPPAAHSALQHAMMTYEVKLGELAVKLGAPVLPTHFSRFERETNRRYQPSKSPP